MSKKEFGCGSAVLNYDHSFSCFLWLYFFKELSLVERLENGE
ncbi:MAG: hypothetical protein PF904_19045 [Kiritimatiellae bacterium]|nr:hypothetical protein [Kiritimatiellia bacterium]